MPIFLIRLPIVQRVISKLSLTFQTFHNITIEDANKPQKFSDEGLKNSC